MDLSVLYGNCRGSNIVSIMDFRWARTRRCSTFMTTEVRANFSNLKEKSLSLLARGKALVYSW